jgi:hypothetical protein
MGFKTSLDGENLHYVHYVHYVYHLIVEFVLWLQVNVELSIEDCVLKDTRANLADSVDSLGDEFSPLFHAGWLAYINKTVGANQPRQGQEPVVVED